jgi:hypothetical protein
MKRTATGLGVAAAIACAVTLGAQTSTTTGSQRTSTTTDKSHDVTVTGCLARDTNGSGFILNNAKMDNGASSTTTTSGTTTAGTTGATTSGTNASASMSNAPAMNWMLSGGSDLDKHVGHKIQVTGKTTFDPAMSHTSTSSAAGAGTTASSSTPTTTGAATGTTGSREESRSGDSHGMQPRLDVQSIKMVSTSCS